MKKVEIRKNATLSHDDDDCFWLRLDASNGQSLALNLTTMMSNKVTHQIDEGSQETLAAFMADQESPDAGSLN